MRMKKLLGLMLAAAMMCTTVFTGCGGDTTAPATDDKGTDVKTEETKKEETAASDDNAERAAVQELVICNNSDPLTWDPALSNTVPDQQQQTLVYEGLTKRMLDEDGKMYLAPAVAESWDVSEDGMTYTFHIRENATWSDGTPLTANDFEYSWKRLFTPETASPQAWLMYEIVEGAQAAFMGEAPVDDIGVKALDEHTFEVKLAKKDPNFLSLAGYNFARPVKKELIDKFGSQYGADIKNIVGNGPFNVVAWDVGAQIVYEKNPNYWNAENVALTKVTVKMIQETSTQAQALMANELDIAGLNNPDWNSMVDETGYYNVVEQDRMNMEDLLFNCEKKPFNNWKVRLAMALAFDREAYNEEINNGASAPMYGFSPSICVVNGESYAELTGGKNQVYKTLAEKYPDPKALLMEGIKEEGYNDPSEVTVEFYTRGTNEYCKKSAEWMKQCFESKLGINFSINMTEWNVMYDLVDAGDYQLASMGWSADVGLEPNEFMDLYDNVDGYYAPRMRWTGAEADKFHELVQAYKTAPEDDTKAKADAYFAAEEYLCEYGPTIPTHAGRARTLIGKYVHGYTPHPLIMNDYSTVWLSER